MNRHLRGSTRRALTLALLAWGTAAQAQDAAQRFADTLTARQLMTRFDAQAMNEAIARFNRQQDRLLPGGEEVGLRPLGHQQARWEDAGPAFIVHFNQVVQAHSAGIDNGVNEERAFVFDKRSLAQLGEWEGALQEAPAQSPLRLLVPGQTDCLGFRPQGQVHVVSLRSGQRLHALELPQGAGVLQTQALSGGAAFKLQYELQESVPYPAGQPRCDVSEWVRRSTYSLLLRCDARRSHCKAGPAQLEGTDEGCADIGGCD